MKIKFNWGTGIAIAIVLMVSGMLYLVSIASRQDYYLVEDDYYQKSVNYQQKIDKIKNVNLLEEKVQLTQLGSNLQLSFPALFKHDLLEGTIQVYSPVSERNDLNIPLQLDSTLQQLVEVSRLPKGRYKIKLDWTADEKPFFQELEIMLE